MLHSSEPSISALFSDSDRPEDLFYNSTENKVQNQASYSGSGGFNRQASGDADVDAKRKQTVLGCLFLKYFVTRDAEELDSMFMIYT